MLLLIGSSIGHNLISNIADIAEATNVTIVPLWNTDATMCSVTTSNISDNTIAFSGLTHQMCSLQLMVTLGAGFQMQVSHNQSRLDDSFLLVENLGDVLDCENRYTVLKETSTNCNLVFWNAHVQVNLLGNASLLIKIVEGDSLLVPCPDAMDNSAMMPHTGNECFVEEYNNAIICTSENTHSWWGFIRYMPGLCSLDFQSDCNVTLSNRMAAFYCEEMTNNKESIILYPNSNDVRVLDLIGNNIMYINKGSFRTFSNLQVLFLNGNNLETINAGIFDGLGNVEKMYLNNNNLIALDNSIFADLQSLVELYLYGNKFVSLHSSWFDGLGNLRILTFYGNILNKLPLGLFEGMGNLQKLYLQENKLATLETGVFQGLVRLVFLRLDNNMLNVAQPGSFRGLSNLATLYLFRNQLVSMDADVFQGLFNLQSLYLFENNLIKLNVNLFQNMTRLLILSLGNNQIDSLPNSIFQDIINLQQLYLYKNKLIGLDNDIFENLKKLTFLSIYGNKLVSLNSHLFGKLHSLLYLYLYDNRISQIEKGAFQKLRNLIKLHLGNNSLLTIDKNLIKNKIHLTHLDLSTNRLQNVPHFANGSHLSFLNLQGNPLSSIDNNTFANLRPSTELFVSQHEICECYVSKRVNCSAASVRSPYLTCDRLLSDRVLMSFMWLIGINALAGNIFVLAWRKSQTLKNKAQALLLSNLAMSDLLMGVYMILIASADVYFGQYFPMRAESWRSGITCRIAGAISISSSEASVFFIMLISVDRFINIKYPHSTKKLNKQSVIKVCLITWVISMALGIVPSILAGVNPQFYDNSHVCIGLPLALVRGYSVNVTSERICPGQGFCYKKIIAESISHEEDFGMYFSSIVFLGVNCICYLTILLCYVEIVRTVYKSSKRAGLNKDMKEQIRMTVKVAAIVTTDFMCWFPIILCGILVQSRLLTLTPAFFAWSVTFILPINSAINPYLYTISSIISSRLKQVESSSMGNSQQHTTRNTQATDVRTSYVSRPVGITGNAPEHIALPNVPVDQEV